MPGPTDAQARVRWMVRFLRRRYPTPKPVRLRFVSQTEPASNGLPTAGLMRETPSSFILEIRRGCKQCMLTTAIHEYAHALDASECPERRKAHSNRFYELLGILEEAYYVELLGAHPHE